MSSVGSAAFVSPGPRNEPAAAAASAVLTIDLEDWNQLIARQSGARDWDRPCAAFPRQVDALLALLDRMGAHATFFVLGLTAKNYGDVVRKIAARGHAIASHGYGHNPVWLQSRASFRADLERSIDVIGSTAGARPRGYRAPAFSIKRSDLWAYEVLADLGFEYDSSQHDSPWIRDRIVPIRPGPHVMSLPSGRTLVEFPPAVLRLSRARLPFGGGSYWRVLPDLVIRRAIAAHIERGDAPTLYFHPYEFDPEALRLAARSPGARVRELRYNVRRSGIGERLSRLGRRLPFITCEDYIEQHRRAGEAPLSGTCSVVRPAVRGPGQR
ncbi:MAG TPA: polysaccharide deacetylase family protein [Polyangiaceae bacterium]|nr:polysaccharide deacetylase family protein [Polyangiaceae bacterium]